jgi:type 1 glutamine amidotransferase
MTPVASADQPVRVLMVTATAGFHHTSIETAQVALPRLAQESGAFSLIVLPDLSDLTRFTPEALTQTDVVFFANTSGELPLDDGQKQALLGFVARGGGFAGTHSATDTFYEWPEYEQLVGTHFQEHPWTQPVRFTLEDATHPIVQGLDVASPWLEEVYVFRTTPRPQVHVLFSLDARSVGANPATEDHPLAWCSSFGSGRAFYTALGHFDELWEDARFHRLLMNGFRWAAGRT